MAVQRIPVNPQLPDQTLETVLGGRAFRLRFVWNTREAAWFVTISTREGVPLLTGLKVVLNYELIDRFADERLPRGFLVALDTTRRLTTIDRFALGDSVALVFVPFEDIAP